MNPDNIHKENEMNITLEKLSKEGEWLNSFKLPDGRFTKIKRKKISDKDLKKTQMLHSFNVSGKRVLDLGCSEGIYSFYLAEQGANVFGVDIDENRVRKAKFLSNALGISKVNFECGSILDPEFRETLGEFDLVLAWGFLHRVPDPFNALIAMASIGDAISLEWRAPWMLFPSILSYAIHNAEGTFEWKNVDDKALGSNQYSPDRKGAKPADFWRMSPAAVGAILYKFNFRETSINTIKFEASTLSISTNWINLFINLLFSRKKTIGWQPSRRVHMLFEKKGSNILHPHFKQKTFKPAVWDGRF